jgi:hypothetical protein
MEPEGDVMRCPKCRHEIDYRDALVEEEWRRIIELLPAFSGHGRLVWEYVELFGVTPLALKTKKLLRLLEEVGALFVQKKFSWKKCEYEISEKGIVEGLKMMCNNPNLAIPLANHNYLRAVLASISMHEQKERRDRTDAAQRRKEEVHATKIHPVEFPKGDPIQQGKLRHEEEVLSNKENFEPSCLGGEILSPKENAKRAAEIAASIGRKME